MQYEVEMHHSEESFEALAHMQYNLFCGKNWAARSFISLALVLVFSGLLGQTAGRRMASHVPPTPKPM